MKSDINSDNKNFIIKRNDSYINDNEINNRESPFKTENKYVLNFNKVFVGSISNEIESY